MTEMAPHNTNIRGAEARLLTIPDPGNAGSISAGSRMVTHVGLVTAAAETRTLLDPTSPGQQLTISFKTDAGDAVVTAASAINQAGNTIMTLADAGDVIQLVAMEEGTSLEWRAIGNDGVALS